MKISMVNSLFAAMLITYMSTAPIAGGSSLEKIWEIDSLNNPESVVYDPEINVLYVSNINGPTNEKDGNGFISKVSLGGDILDKQWVTGLDAPKGLAIFNNKLYTADIDTLVEIDIKTATITNRYTATDAKFLNDVTASQDGKVFVSDTVMNRIYLLKDGKFGVWLESPDLLNPNGLHVQGNRLIVGAWGVMNDDFSTETPGHMLSVSMVDKSIASIGDGSPIGNLDGVEEDTDGSFYVTDWMAGKLYHISPAGGADLLLTLEQGMADHEFIASSGLILIPMMMMNKLLAYRIY